MTPEQQIRQHAEKHLGTRGSVKVSGVRRESNYYAGTVLLTTTALLPRERFPRVEHHRGCCTSTRHAPTCRKSLVWTPTHRPASLVSASPNLSCFTPMLSSTDRYRLHSLRSASFLPV